MKMKQHYLDMERAEKHDEIRDTLDAALSKVNEDGADEILILLKSEGRYVRYSTPIADTMQAVGQLELLKFDILQRSTK